MPISTIGTDGLSTSPTLTTPKATTTIGVGNATPSTSGAGITFPATQSASTDVNTLDDYEEGTWTPVIGGEVSESGQTYSGQVGTYTKIGRLVTARFDATLSAKGTINTSFVQIKGFPFTMSGGNAIGGAAFGFFASLGTNWSYLGYYETTGTAIYVIGTQAAATQIAYLPPSAVTNTTRLAGTITYFTT